MLLLVWVELMGASIDSLSLAVVLLFGGEAGCITMDPGVDFRALEVRGAAGFSVG